MIRVIVIIALRKIGSENSEDLPLHSARRPMLLLRDTEGQTLSQYTGVRTHSNTLPDVFWCYLKCN